MVEQIKSFGITRLSLGATSDFHTHVNELVVSATPSALNIVELAGPYAEAVALVTSLVNRSTAFVATASMREAEKKRDNLVGVISSLVKAHLTNPIADKNAAAVLLDALLAPYFGIGRHEQSKETAEIKGMIGVLKGADAAAAVEKLEMKDEVEALEAANGDFEQAFLEKAAEASVRQAQSNVITKDAVAAVNELYQQIVQTVNAYAIVQSSDVIRKFISDVNGLVIVYSDLANGSTSGGSAPGGGGGGGEEERPGEL